MRDKKLYIAMVGLPARGKSTLAMKLKDSLSRESVKIKIFNNGNLRRKIIHNNSSYAKFFDPKNEEGVVLREKIARTNIQRARKYINTRGNVAILDATNINKERRYLLQESLNDHPILFIECINNDTDILDASILRKINLPEFGHLNQSDAIVSFNDRIAYYKSTYAPLEEERNFVRVDSLNNEILQEEINDEIPYFEQIRDFLATNVIKSLYLIRHGETYFNLENRIGGDSGLTEKGIIQAETLAQYFRNRDIPLIFTSEKKRTIQTAEPIKELQGNCTIIPLKEFNEISSGECECMSYQEIRDSRPEIYKDRKKDKYNYEYPGGEGYVSMETRIDKGIKKALYLSNPSDNIMIIGHRAVNRMILSHFLFRKRKDVPYIYIPQDRFYYISSTHNKKVFQLKSYK